MCSGFTDQSSPSSPNSGSYEPQWPLTPVASTDGGSQTIIVVPEQSDDEGDVNEFKTATDAARQQGANNRALELLAIHAGEGESVKHYKSTVDTARERGANAKAIALLESTVGSRVSEVAKATSVSQVAQNPSSTGLSGAMAGRQAATTEYEKLLKQKAEIKAKLKQEKKKHANAPPVLAETTRKPKERTAEDLRDPETIPGMKCQLDLEREVWAQKTAHRTIEMLRKFDRNCDRFA